MNLIDRSQKGHMGMFSGQSEYMVVDKHIDIDLIRYNGHPTL